MTRVGYPSDLFPGPLGASLDLPDGWAPVPVASAAMACRKLDSAHSFAPNIIVRTSSRGIDHSLRTAIAELAAFVDTQPQGVVDPTFDVELGGQAWVGVTVSWADPEFGRIVQTHLFVAESRGGRVDLLQVTGSVGGSAAREEYAEIKAVMSTVEVIR
ncbi:hypothetical protein [Janibacter massiliensis]|uniref:hypothetical protein n=1 Tax=Janibacter massiliensis TaxID=2058291 RepID=UPI000D0F2664|nr:hypothetical protein [Janibacter massiliensis]